VRLCEEGLNRGKLDAVSQGNVQLAN